MIMEDKSSVSDLRDHLSSLMSTAILFQDVCAVLAQSEADILLLKSSVTRLTDELEASQKEIKTLRDRYSELLYKFSEIRNNS